jgi:hypothetical protein
VPTRSDEAAAALASGLAYLQSVQRSDGGLEGYTAGSSTSLPHQGRHRPGGGGLPQAALTATGGTTAWTIWLPRPTLRSRRQQRGLSGRAGMLAVGVVAGGGDPASFGGVDLIGELSGSYQAATAPTAPRLRRAIPPATPR